MKTKPILFSTPMVQAILDGRKTQTRRICKIQPKEWQGYKKYGDGTFNIAGPDFDSNDIEAKYKVGDIMWVRETTAKMFEIHEELVGKDKEDMGYWYKTDGELSEAPFYIEGHKWNPSIFMPREACRIFLEVTNIRVERLQDISESDAISEGINPKSGVVNANHAKNCFQSLWQMINGTQSWHDNPWVWVYDFKRVERPENFLK